MSKKYILRDLMDRKVIIHTENGPDPEYPVVYSCESMTDSRRWFPMNTSPLGSKTCCLEEVPEEPIDVGFSWKRGYSIYKVVHKCANDGGVFFLVVSEDTRGVQYLEDSPSTWRWWSESEIKQESENGN